MSDPVFAGGAPGPLFSARLEAAARLAARGHYHQFRKQLPEALEVDPAANPLPDGAVPYVTHLMATMAILARVGADEDVLAAGLLHDYLEDVDDPDGAATIRDAVGDRVLELVRAVTEDKRRERDEAETWEVRKREQIAHVARMPRDAVLVKAADVLHNLVSLRSDLERADDPGRVWSRFNAGPHRQMWYFEAIAAEVANRLGDHQLSHDLADAVAGVRAVLGSG
jgi:(p)ppGpp synthase/HD superfamily hydrolase